MFARRVVIAFAVILSQASPALALQPISDWKIEPSDARCVAVRKYGAADKPITLAVKAPPSGDSAQLLVMRSGYRKAFEQTGAKLIIDGKEFSTTALSYPLGGDKRRVAHLINLDASSSAALRSARDLQLTVIGSINESFPVGPNTGVWKEIDDCLARIRDAWNVGEERSSRIATGARAIIPLSALFSADDYPVRAVLADESGKTRIGLMIDELGKVRDCTLIEASGIAMLDSRSCGIIIQRGKFAPSIGPDGKPVKSYWVQTIRWQLVG